MAEAGRRSAPRARLLGLLLLALLLPDLARGQARPPAPASARVKAAEPAPVRVTSAEVAGRAVRRSIDTSGRLLAWEEAVARTEIPGTVVRLYVDLGDPVQEGQPLAELDRREADLALDQLVADLAAAREHLARAGAAADTSRATLDRVREGRRALAADVERARADAEWKRREHERSQELLAKELIAARDVDQALAQVQAAETLVQATETALTLHADQVRAAEAQLEADQGTVKAAEALVRQREAAVEAGQQRAADTLVPAPLTGVVAKRHVALGERVMDDAPLFTVVATDPLKYTGTVAARAAPEIRAGQEVRLTVDALGARRAFPAQVTRVAPVVDDRSGPWRSRRASQMARGSSGRAFPPADGSRCAGTTGYRSSRRRRWPPRPGSARCSSSPTGGPRSAGSGPGPGRRAGWRSWTEWSPARWSRPRGSPGSMTAPP
jgi:multidrug resistance efflux pump